MSMANIFTKILFVIISAFIALLVVLGFIVGSILHFMCSLADRMNIQLSDEE